MKHSNILHNHTGDFKRLWIILSLIIPILNIIILSNSPEKEKCKIVRSFEDRSMFWSQKLVEPRVLKGNPRWKYNLLANKPIWNSAYYLWPLEYKLFYMPFFSKWKSQIKSYEINLTILLELKISTQLDNTKWLMMEELK